MNRLTSSSALYFSWILRRATVSYVNRSFSLSWHHWKILVYEKYFQNILNIISENSILNL